MNHRIAIHGLLLLLLTGCGDSAQKPVQAMRELIDEMNALGETLQGIRDRPSAEASLDALDQKYAALCATFKGMPELMRQYKDLKVSQSTIDESRRDMNSAKERVKAEQKRLTNTRGLPMQFWKIVTVRSFEIGDAGVEFAQAMNGSAPKDAANWIHDTHNLVESCGFEKIFKVEFVNLPSDFAQVAYDRLKKAAPGATLYHGPEDDAEAAWMGPVPDFKAMVSKLDMGKIVFEDEPRRTVRIEVDRRKLGARTDSDQDEFRLKAKEQFDRQVAESKKDQDAFDAKLMQDRKQEEERRLAREKEERGPDSSDPQYYDKLVERMSSTNQIYRDNAIAALLAADPSQASADARKKVARGFKTLAEGENVFDRGKAAQGLIRWAGAYSVPILVKMLDSRGGLFGEKEILKGLADFKDPRAAKVFASRLGNLQDGQLAVDALHDMGSGAEDAVLEVAQSWNPRICIAAVTLLGDIGTTKSFKTLQQGIKSNNSSVRTAAQDSIRKINIRTRQAKAKPKPAEE